MLPPSTYDLEIMRSILTGSFLLYRIILLLILIQSIASDSAISNGETTSASKNPADSKSSDTNSDQMPNTNIGAAATSTASTPKVRLITKEELELHDGKQMDTMWVSVMSQVFDVTAGPEYYSENGPYRVFVARDGNVPFLTGVFTPEEAAKPITDLDDGQLAGLEQWVNFYTKEDKYPFIGYLIGELYDENGKPTDIYWDLEDRIAALKVKNEQRRRETQKLIDKQTKELEERKKQEKANKSGNAVVRKLLSFLSSLLRRGKNDKKEL